MAFSNRQAGLMSPNLGGPAWVSKSDFMFNGSVFFVDPNHTNASDNSARTGTQPEAPFVTWAHAYTKASDGDMIVCAAGMEETIYATVAKRIITVGLGSGDSIPQFYFDQSGPSGNAPTFTVTVACVEFWNIRFRGYVGVGEVTHGQTAHIIFDDAAHAPRLVDCVFVFEERASGAPSPQNSIVLGVTSANPDYGWVEGCQWVNNCTLPDAGPSTVSPLTCILWDKTGSGTGRGWRIRGNTFDGGDTGYDYAAIYGANLVVYDCLIYGNTFYNGASIKFLNKMRGICAGNDMDPTCIVDLGANWTGLYEPNGLVGVDEGGNPILSASEFYTFGAVIWVNPLHPNASDSNAGTNRQYPLLSLDSLNSKLSLDDFGDIVIIEADCALTIASGGLEISNKSVKVFGLGSGSSQPTISFDNADVAADEALLLSGIGTEVHGLHFLAVTSSGGGDTYHVNLDGGCHVVEGCQFDIGAANKYAITCSVEGVDIDANLFTVTATGATSAINTGSVASGGPVQRCEIRNNQFVANAKVKLSGYTINWNINCPQARIEDNVLTGGLSPYFRAFSSNGRMLWVGNTTDAGSSVSV